MDHPQFSEHDWQQECQQLFSRSNLCGAWIT
jgi:hypothetical protein